MHRSVEGLHPGALRPLRCGRMRRRHGVDLRLRAPVSCSRSAGVKTADTGDSELWRATNRHSPSTVCRRSSGRPFATPECAQLETDKCAKCLLFMYERVKPCSSIICRDLVGKLLVLHVAQMGEGQLTANSERRIAKREPRSCRVRCLAQDSDCYKEAI